MTSEPKDRVSEPEGTAREANHVREPRQPARLGGQSELNTWQKFIGENVVIDTNSPYLYLGKLVSCDDWFITLSDVDVHDQKEGSSTKEQYVNEAGKSGIKINRKQVIIRKSQIISFSRLEDVVSY